MISESNFRRLNELPWSLEAHLSGAFLDSEIIQISSDKKLAQRNCRPVKEMLFVSVLLCLVFSVC